MGSRGLWAGVLGGWSPFEAAGARLGLQHCPTALMTMLGPRAAVWFRPCRRSVSSARCAPDPAAVAAATRAASVASGGAGGRTRGLRAGVPRAGSALPPRAPPRACALADSRPRKPGGGGAGAEAGSRGTEGGAPLAAALYRSPWAPGFLALLDPVPISQTRRRRGGALAICCAPVEGRAGCLGSRSIQLRECPLLV